MNDSEIVSLLRGSLPDWYFVNASLPRMRRHMEVLRLLDQHQIICDFQHPAEVRLTELTLCAYDDAEPGLLAKMSGVLAALRLTVPTAFIYTLRGIPGAKSVKKRRWIVLDTLLLGENYHGRQRPLFPETEARLRTTLESVLRGQQTVDQPGGRGRRRASPLNLLDLSFRNEGLQTREGASLTTIRLRANDDSGLLYRITSALAQIGINIYSAQINTHDRCADDIFFVTDQNGQALANNKLVAAENNLRTILLTI